jgi:hypothetical protein
MMFALGLGMGLRRPDRIPELMDETFSDSRGDERVRRIDSVRSAARDIHDRLEKVEPGSHILVPLGTQILQFQPMPANTDAQFIRGLANVLMYGWLWGEQNPDTGELLLNTDADAEIRRWRGNPLDLTPPPYAHGSLATLLLDRAYRYGPMLHEFRTGGRQHFQMANASTELVTEIRAMSHLGDQLMTT